MHLMAHFRRPVITLVLIAMAICFYWGQSASRAQESGEKKGQPVELAALQYRLLGPGWGGRVSHVTGVAGTPVFYAATAGGGVWKSSDHGVSWQSIWDSQPIASIGSIAVAPSDPNVIYVGSGEANIRGNVASTRPTRRLPLRRCWAMPSGRIRSVASTEQPMADGRGSRY